MKRQSRATREPSDTKLPAVDLHTFDGLRNSLHQMSVLYEARPREVREHVIAAKDRAKFAARNARAALAKRADKAEMAEWMLVWLDDPSMFAMWAELRLAAMESIKCDVCTGTGQCTQCKGTSNGGQCFNCAGTGHCPQCQGTGRRKT